MRRLRERVREPAAAPGERHPSRSPQHRENGGAWETALKVVGAVGALVAPTLSLAFLISRRNRLLNRLNSYVRLANEIEGFDPEGAGEVRDLAKQAVRQLVDTERTSLTRRFDVAAALAFLILLVPSVALFAWASTLDEWWRWPLFSVAVVLALLVGVAAWDALWKPHDEADEQPATTP